MQNAEKYIRVRVKTKAKHETIKKKKGVYYIEVKEKAERGEANKKIPEILAKEINCNPKRLRLVKGAKTTSKTYLLANTKRA